MPESPRIIAHIDPYPLGDSAEGIDLAAVRGYLGIDLNTRTCRANRWRPWRRIRRAVLVHWSHWWLHGFEPIPGTEVPHKPIEDLTLAQVRNLWSIDGHHRILTAEQAVDLCSQRGLVPCFELKPSLWPGAVLRNLAQYAAARSCPAVAMTIQAYGRSSSARARWERAAHDRMSTARYAGLYTMLLWRQSVAWPWWEPVLDAIKDHGGHGQVASAAQLLERLHTELASRGA